MDHPDFSCSDCQPPTVNALARMIKVEDPAAPTRFTLAEVVGRVSLRHFPVYVTLTAMDVGLRISAQVRDRNTGTMKYIDFQFSPPLRVYLTDEQDSYLAGRHWTMESGVRFVYNCLLEVLRHELDETFMFEGCRVFDPHHDDGKKLRETMIDRKAPW